MVIAIGIITIVTQTITGRAWEINKENLFADLKVTPTITGILYSNNNTYGPPREVIRLHLLQVVIQVAVVPQQRWCVSSSPLIRKEI